MRLFRFSLVLCSVFAAHHAWADATAGEDEVTLKDGATLRGTLVTEEPGREVDILILGESAPRVVPWADVNRVERGKYAAPKPSSQPSASPPRPQSGVSRLGDPGIVALHITSRVPVALYAHTDSFGSTDGGQAFVLDTPTLICSSPCDTRVDTRGARAFTVIGESAVESPRFSLNGLSGNEELVVSPGSPGVRGAGALFAGLGGAAIGVGLVLAIGGAVSKADFPNGQTFETAGLITLSSGLVALIGGVILYGYGGTTVHVRATDPPAGTPRVAIAPRYWAGEF